MRYRKVQPEAVLFERGGAVGKRKTPEDAADDDDGNGTDGPG